MTRVSDLAGATSEAQAVRQTREHRTGEPWAPGGIHRNGFGPSMIDDDTRLVASVGRVGIGQKQSYLVVTNEMGRRLDAALSGSTQFLEDGEYVVELAGRN